MSSLIAWVMPWLDLLVWFQVTHGWKLENAAKTCYWIVGIFGWLCVSAASLAFVYAVWRIH